MSARAVAFVALAAVALGCAKRPGTQVERDLRVLKEEETPEKLVARGRAFAEVGDFTRAEQYLAGALERGADARVVMPILLKVCIAERRYRVAIDYAEPELKKHPDDFRLRFLVASLHVTVGDTKAARAELERVAHDKPDFAPVRFALGVLLRDEVGDLALADTHFREYLRIEPNGQHADEARGSLLREVRAVPKVGTTLPPIMPEVPGNKPARAPGPENITPHPTKQVPVQVSPP